MSTVYLNEHDANQGAQSKGEFLGMTGNSAWYLLGAAGGSVLLVILLWGILGFSLLVCLSLGLLLCALALAYVFALKNHRPAHFDTDFFESVLIEAGVCELVFGPRASSPKNPFAAALGAPARAGETGETRQAGLIGSSAEEVADRKSGSPVKSADKAAPRPQEAPVSGHRTEEPATVPLSTHERLQGELAAAQELLDETAAMHEEDAICD